MKGVLYKDLGRMGYSECWDLQRSLFDCVLAAKRGGAVAGGADVGTADMTDLSGHEAGWLLTVNTILFTH